LVRKHLRVVALSRLQHCPEAQAHIVEGTLNLLKLVGRRLVSAPVETELRLERERCGAGEGSDSLLFPSPNNPAVAVDVSVVTGWLRQAEKLAGLTPMERGAWHPFRRMWACQRKGQSVQDVAFAGGWKDLTVLQGVSQTADAETLEAVVSGGKRLKGVRR
jgi:hypothetical protein